MARQQSIVWSKWHFLLNLSILLVLTHLYLSVSYLISTSDEKAVIIGKVWLLLIKTYWTPKRWDTFSSAVCKSHLLATSPTSRTKLFFHMGVVSCASQPNDWGLGVFMLVCCLLAFKCLVWGCFPKSLSTEVMRGNSGKHFLGFSIGGFY